MTYEGKRLGAADSVGGGDDAPSDIFSQIARTAIRRVEVATAYGPPIVLDDPFAPGPPNPALQRLRPKISIYTRGQRTPIVIAPYGKPGPSRWPDIERGLKILGLGLAGLGVFWVVRRL